MPGRRVRIKGIVQGVGFRPFVYRLANSLHLKGFVRNTTDGVEIEVTGLQENLGRFISGLRTGKPRAARIDRIDVTHQEVTRHEGFSIVKSKVSDGFTQISPDIATCAECLEEMKDPQNRRHDFPFINCTNCGPRYSIIIDTPYDRGRTSMAEFKMCDDCRQEFQDITDRRFHAQPDCCDVCGPTYTLYSIAGKKVKTNDPISAAVKLLKKGKIIAIKGIGGFHIACDAQLSDVVRRLRKLKNRPTKPLAVMIHPSRVKDIAQLSADEERIMYSPVAPVVLLRKKSDEICEDVAPQNPYLGIMFPYAPIHHLIVSRIPYLVMTSANIQDEPVAKDTMEVKRKLSSIVSHYLDHNRNIENRCDDSVGYFLADKGFSIIRRSRGYAPIPVELPIPVRPTLAVGPYLKNTFALANGVEAYLSPHIGDLDNLATLQFFHEMLEKYQRWFRIHPRLVVHDLHPDYLSTKIAQKMPGAKRGVQHHIAHFVSCLGENRVAEQSIGIVFDGTGYGLDGKIWGGEFFTGNLQSQQRTAHLQYLPLPGGESSIRKPYRIAVAYAHSLLHKSLKITPDSEVKIIQKIIDEESNVVYTSSMGRLFDCVSAMLGVTNEITYEAEAAINLEHIADQKAKGCYPYAIIDNDPMIIEVKDTLRAVLEQKKTGVAAETISARFHNTIVELSYDVADRLRRIHGLNSVCLSGGVFQNRFLLNSLIDRLTKGGFKLHAHQQLPNNDGCISYGQVIAGNAAVKE
jgi:hydrogenase maturation protein HypF